MDAKIIAMIHDLSIQAANDVLNASYVIPRAPIQGNGVREALKFRYMMGYVRAHLIIEAWEADENARP